MRRVYLSEIFPPTHGGSGRWLYELSRRQPRNATMAVVDRLSTGDEELDDADGWVRRIDFSLADTGGLSPRGAWGYWRLLRRVAAALPAEPSAVLHAARVLPEGWLAYLHSLRTGTPYVCFAHGEELNLVGCHEGGVMASRQHRWMARRVLRRAQGMIANSENTGRILTEQWRVPAAKVTVLSPGVDTQTFVPAAKDPTLRQALGWRDSPVVLTVGRLQKRKGHDQVIRALPQILSAIPDLKYAIVGDGEERDSLMALAEQTGVLASVCWHPEVSDGELLGIYQQCDLFVLANRQIGSDVEGFGMVLLEAAACGKATVAGRSGGTREAMVDGITGRLVDAEDPDEIAAVVIELLNDEATRQAMGRAGRTRAEAEFDWSVLAGRV